VLLFGELLWGSLVRCSLLAALWPTEAINKSNIAKAFMERTLSKHDLGIALE